MAAEDGKVYARLTVTGTNKGKFFCIPATGHRYEVSMFDYAKVEDGKIVERLQQSDTLSQMRQIYAGAAKKVATVAGVFGTAAALLALHRRGRTSFGIRT